uniref:Uncharacterized protein n=2 Tax=Calcidiscus leptoporus TaxID=127549 RepID=A0A7S0J1X8_9EUKA
MPVHFSNPDVLWKTQHPYTARPPPRLLSTAHVRIRFRQAHLNSSSAALCHCSWARFGQGAFKIALRALYATKLRHLRVPEETHDERIASSFKQWGKPTDSTFRFLEARLRSLAPDSAQQPKAERFYMIGDNPASDMEGVRRANIFHRTAALPEKSTSWAGILVRTGVFKDGDETNLAEVVTDGVAGAVEYVLKKEGKA